MLGAGALYVSLSKLPDVMKQLKEADVEIGLFGKAVGALGQAFSFAKDPIGHMSRKLKDAQDDLANATSAYDKYIEHLKQRSKDIEEASYNAYVRRQVKSATKETEIDDAYAWAQTAEDNIKALTIMRDMVQQRLGRGEIWRGETTESLKARIESYNRQISDQQSVRDAAQANIDLRTNLSKQLKRTFEELAKTRLSEQRKEEREAWKTMPAANLQQPYQEQLEKLREARDRLAQADKSLSRMHSDFYVEKDLKKRQTLLNRIDETLKNRAKAASDIEYYTGTTNELRKRLGLDAREKKQQFQWEWAWQAPKALNSLAAMGGGMGENYRAPYEEDLDVIKRVLKLIEENTKKNEEAGLA